jgi:hypothetical protein
MRDVLASTSQDVVSLLAGIWVREPHPNLNFGARAGPALLGLISGHPALSFERTQLFIDSADVDAQRMANLFLQHVYTALFMCTDSDSDASGPPARELFRCEVVIIGLVATINKDMQRALVAQDSISLFTTAIHHLAFESNDEVAESIALCTRYLTQAIPTADGVTGIIQAIRAKLLPALLQCTKFQFDQEDEDDIIRLLSVGIPQYFVYRSVLREAARSLDGIDLTSLKSGRLGHAWAKLKQLLDERLRIKADYDAKVKYSHTCASLEVC